MSNNSDSEFDSGSDDRKTEGRNSNVENSPPVDPETRQDGGAEVCSGQDFDVESGVAKVGRYEIKQRLGEGGFGFVYLAMDPELHRKVAIKVPRWDRKLNEYSVQQFLKEGKMLAQVSHPSIVSVHDVGTTADGVPFVVMEFVEGRDLSWVIKNENLDLDEILAILLKIAAALQHAHKKGIVHRDFKPTNVILDDIGEIHLVDFGLALHDELSGDDWETDRVAGTPGYMAPEQVRGENHLLDGQTDIWAFGVTMYRMLVGTLPFRAKGVREMMRAICYRNPKPLRQLDEKIPRQLERICLRCLEKLMADRYQSMADVIEEIEAFRKEQMERLKQSDRGQKTTATLEKFGTGGPPSSAIETGSEPVRSGRSSSRGPTKIDSTSHTNAESAGPTLSIVPKGLRSFDQSDREFFLNLLPGPVDRLGVPESVKFWINRLGVVDQIDEVAVGVIYGPSGSGKSSFVRAGLIPQLPENVIDIYLDCASDKLEHAIARQLERVFPDVSSQDQLSQTLRRIRNGEVLREGDKLLLILDQFEQWLSGTRHQEQQDLTEALRQCDSQRVQVLILIRDEFWLSMSQYLRCLGHKIVEGRNAMPLPLFDRRHARKVLEAIGRAYHQLPASGQLTKPQRAFIREAVDSLANRDRVICVHLSVFAETTRDSNWEVSQLRARGGWDGIGREYIAGIFENPETPRFIERHSQQAWGILRQLLPETSSDLKGVSVERGKLYESSHVPMSKASFDELIRFLEFDCNLISRTELAEDDAGSESTIPTYHLTHDFLVTPIREWGNAKQNETISGRARSEMVNLADQWSITKDRRFLPSLWDFGRFALFTDSATKNQFKSYWSQASKTAVTKVAGLTGLLAILLVLGVWGMGASEARLESDLNDALVCAPKEFEQKLEGLTSRLTVLAKHLRDAASHENPDTRFRANCLRLVNDPADQDAIAGITRDMSLVSLNECLALAVTTEQHKNELAPVWNRIVDRRIEQAIRRDSEGEENEATANSDLVSCCRLAIHLALLGDSTSLAKVMNASENPSARSIGILELANWQAKFSGLIKHLAPDSKIGDNSDLISALSSAIAINGLRSDEVTKQERDVIVEWLSKAYVANPHGGVHSAAWFALKKLGVDVPRSGGQLQGSQNRQWKHVVIDVPGGDSVQLTFVKILPGEFESEAGAFISREMLNLSGDYPPAGESVKVEKPYWISVTPVGNGQLIDLMETMQTMPDYVARNLDSVRKTKDDTRWKEKNARLNFQSCLALANQVSRYTGKQVYYENLSDMAELSRKDTGGFRLPTEEELEYAIRSGSNTRYYVGNDERTAIRLIGSGGERSEEKSLAHPPNAFGLFDGSTGREHVDKIKFMEGEYAVFFRGGLNDPYPSAEVSFLPYSMTTGWCRLVIDAEKDSGTLTPESVDPATK